MRYIKVKKVAKTSRLGPVTLIAFLLVSFQSFADESRIGIGAVLGSTSGLFFPIQWENYFIEPAIKYKRSKESSVNSIDLSRSGRTSETITIGVGVFKKQSLAEKSELYYGARVGYIRREVDEFFESNSALPSTTSNEESDGLFVSPTIGIQAYIVPQFSLCIDLALQISSTDGVERITTDGIEIVAESDDTSYSSSATIIARYTFD